jgi:copper homeostasis protein
VDSIESARAAEAGGAGRLELCDNLAEGGTTPSAGVIAVCRERVGIPLFVLIRARGGDFLYSDADADAMVRDVGVARELGADGVVIGGLRADGSLDLELTRRLLEAARPMAATFHRAFDVCREPDAALEQLIGLGVERVLTSGQAATAIEGAATITRLVRQSAGRITILAGGGVNEDNAAMLTARTGVHEIHVRCTSPVASGMQHRNPRVTFRSLPTEDDQARMVTDPARIGRLVQRLAGAG